jgi:hypothetical protein
VTLLAATATDPIAAYGGLLLILTVVTVGYWITCWIWPFTNCNQVAAPLPHPLPTQPAKTARGSG